MNHRPLLLWVSCAGRTKACGGIEDDDRASACCSHTQVHTMRHLTDVYIGRDWLTVISRSQSMWSILELVHVQEKSPKVTKKMVTWKAWEHLVSCPFAYHSFVSLFHNSWEFALARCYLHVLSCSQTQIEVPHRRWLTQFSSSLRAHLPPSRLMTGIAWLMKMAPACLAHSFLLSRGSRSTLRSRSRSPYLLLRASLLLRRMGLSSRRRS